ncbi:hypothetical protein D9M68_276920 [compost metagenome]
MVQKQLNYHMRGFGRRDNLSRGIKLDVPLLHLVLLAQPFHAPETLIVRSLLHHRHTSQVSGIGADKLD